MDDKIKDVDNMLTDLIDLAKSQVDMAKQKKCKIIKNVLTSIIILAISFVISVLFQNVFKVEEHITTLFVFAVFLISLLTDGYLYGIISSIISMLAINFAFTFPYFAFDFGTPVNIISAIVMIIIAFLTSTITTKIKHQELMKIENEKERTKANLLRAISHDLRTPLTNIYGSTTTLLDNRSNFSKEQEEKILKGIKEDSEWLVRMVENILSITRINAGQVKIIKTPIVLDELIDSVILKFKKRYPNHQFDLITPESIIIIPMDAILIEQVLLNLLENAILHAKNMTKLVLKILLQGNKVIFNVIDDGCGISDDKISKIFTGYYDTDEKILDSSKHNSGIGLSVCETIIKAHGGEIYATNNSDKGVTFSFVLEKEEANDVE